MLKKLIAGVMIACLGLFIIALISSGSRSPVRSEARKEDCARALMSSIGHSTVGYADKVAYEKEVAAKCDGMTIGGKPVVPR